MKINQYDFKKVKFLDNGNRIKENRINKSKIIKLFSFMIRLRNIEIQLSEEYHPADQIRCPVHFCIGQEAIPAAISLNVNNNDYIFSHHRSHGYYFAKHAPIKPFFAELYGKETGCAKECGANAHWSACVDTCRDLRTCGDRSPVPKDCGEAEFESMCVCDHGFYLLDGECVPESECGCVTDELK